jgi:2-isopropylmalate synthase
MFTQGVDPKLDFSDINNLVKTAEFCNQLPIHERHPYAGQLVHTAFSGSHQDAIRKGVDALADANQDIWEVPYLPIDPSDIGRTFEAIIRVNSQSGKAGSAYLLEADHHVRLPRGAEVEFSRLVQQEADTTGKEITSQRIWELANAHYIIPTGRFELINFESSRATRAGKSERVTATIRHNGQDFVVSAIGNGPISAFVDAMRAEFDLTFRLADFGQNTRSATSKAEAAAYVELTVENEDAMQSIYGVGIDTSITMAPIRAMISALNKLPV